MTCAFAHEIQLSPPCKIQDLLRCKPNETTYPSLQINRFKYDLLRNQCIKSSIVTTIVNSLFNKNKTERWPTILRDTNQSASR